MTTEAPVSAPITDLEADSLLGDFGGERHLVGTHCRNCGRNMLGTRTVCSECISRDVERVALPDTGTLYSYTRIHVGADGVRPLGYVDLDGVEVRTLADLLEGADGLAPDSRVELVTRGDDWFFSPIVAN